MERKMEQAFARLEATRHELVALAALGGDASFNRRPRPDAWSAAQVMEHVLVSEALTLGYLRKKLQAGPGLPVATPLSALRLLALRIALASALRVRAPGAAAGVSDHSSLDELQARWDEVRGGWRSLLESFPAELSGRLVFRHPYAGLLTLRHTLGFLQAHLDHHARQVRAALLAAGAETGSACIP